MKKRLLSLSAAIILVLSLLSVPAIAADRAASANLVANPGFESFLNNWTVYGNKSSATINSYNARSGFRCLSLNCPSESTRAYVEQSIAVSGEAAYQLSAFVKGQTTPAAGSMLLYIQAKDASGETVASDYRMAMATTSWTEASCIVNVPASTRSIIIQVQTGGSGSSILVDDISLVRAG